jgi:hypothetical protein
LPCIGSGLDDAAGADVLSVIAVATEISEPYSNQKRSIAIRQSVNAKDSVDK